jgi:hypothetical protein
MRGLFDEKTAQSNCKQYVNKLFDTCVTLKNFARNARKKEQNADLFAKNVEFSSIF